MDELIKFLKARLGEEEADAREVHMPRSCGSVDRDGDFDPDPAKCGCGYPARVLREVATWRAILQQYEKPPVELGERLGGFMAALGFALQAKASKYSGHPDWRHDGCWGRA